MVESILAVIVLYNTPLQNSTTFQSILQALEQHGGMLDILIYDNSFFPQELNLNIKSINLNINYHHDKNNSGLSKAYNFAATVAEKCHKKWLLFLDQDTVFLPDIFVKYNLAVQSNPHIQLFVPMLKLVNQQLFSPCKYIFKRGFLLKSITPGVYKLDYLSPVNSGMLVTLEAFTKVGGYNEKVRLDFSDFQFIERFKKHYNYFFLIDTIGVQDFSNNEQDIEKLNNRYKFFCEGAKYCERENIGDSLQYFLVVLMRATTLAYRTKSLKFYETFSKTYLPK